MDSEPTATLTVVLAGDCPATRAVRDVLRDWSAIGLVHDLLWIWEADAGARNVTAAGLITAGEVRHARLQDLLADRGPAERLRFCVLSSLGGTAAVVSEGVASPMRNILSGRALRPRSTMHCVLTRHGGGGWDDACIWDQWHNVVLAPEESAQPGNFPTVQTSESGGDRADAEFRVHAAAALASVAGLWRGMGRSPFDEQSLPGGPMALVARSHLRHLDAGGVTEQLRDGFATLGDELPRPVLNGRMLEYLESPPQACQDVVNQVVTRHPELFVPSRDEVAEVPPTDVRWWPLLRMFFGFLWASIRSAPSEWLEAVADRAASRVAKSVQNLTLGSNEQPYRVIVRGVGPDGLRDDPRHLAEAAESLSDAVGRYGREERPLPSLEDFWRDAHAGAMTLADGQEHVPGLAGPTVNSRPGLVRSPRDIAPDNDNRFVVDQFMAARTLPEVAPYDVRTAGLLNAALTQIVDAQGAEARAADEQRRALGEWFRPLESSFTVQLGARIDRNLRRRLVEMVSILRGLLDAAESGSQAAPEVRGGAGTLGRRIRWGLVAVVAVIAASAVVAELGKIGWLVVALVAVVAVPLWLLACLVAFFRSAQAEFARSCARRPDDEQSQVAVRNLIRAAREVQLLSMAYSQYLCWAAVLGRFVGDPLARPEAGVQRRPRLGGIMPLGVRLGRAVADPDVSAALVDTARAEVLRPGWLGELWEKVRDRAPAQLGRLGRGLDASHLLKDRTATEDSPLRRWTALVLDQGLDPEPAEELWQKARTSILRRGDATMTKQLFARVEVLDRDGQRAVETGERFLADLLGSLHLPRQFEAQLFTPLGRSEQSATVRETAVIATPALLNRIEVSSSPQSRITIDPTVGGTGDLDQFVVMVETSGVFPGRGHLQLTGTGPGDPGSGSTPEGGPPPSTGAAAGEFSANGHVVQDLHEQL